MAGRFGLPYPSRLAKIKPFFVPKTRRMVGDPAARWTVPGLIAVLLVETFRSGAIS
jgi:hypothetical protein